jgi:PEP-CTERM motif
MVKTSEQHRGRRLQTITTASSFRRETDWFANRSMLGVVGMCDNCSQCQCASQTKGILVSISLKTYLTALALAAAASANATSISSASLGPIQIQLFDLNTLDGVAPSITFINSSGNVATASASAFNFNGNYYSSEWNYGSNSFSSVSANASIPSTTSKANITNGLDDSSPQGASFSASAQESGVHAFCCSLSNANAYARTPWDNVGFTVGANTKVTFSAMATSSANTTVGLDVNNGGLEKAIARVRMSAWGSDSSGSGNQSSNAYIESEAGYNYAWDFQAQEFIYTSLGQQNYRSDMLEVSFTNQSSDNKEGYFLVDVYAYTNSSIPVVPEPETYAMLLAGLGVMAAIARRHRA